MHKQSARRIGGRFAFRDCGAEDFATVVWTSTVTQ
jgi:hypothetical protein